MILVIQSPTISTSVAAVYRTQPSSQLTHLYVIVGTENAKRNLEESGFLKLLKTIEPASPTDCALAIIKGGTLKQREVYFPYIEALSVTMLRDWIPSVFEAVSRHLYSDVDIS